MSGTIKEAVTAAAADLLINDAAGKKWYVSKTFWVNVLAATALLTQMKWGFVFDAGSQALALTAINLVLRKITKEPIVF